MRLTALAVSIIALAALAGCSGKSTPPPNPATVPGSAAAAGTTVDPCSLITADEATAVLGEPAKNGAPHSFQSTRQCQWDSANGSVAILVYVGGQKDLWSSTHNTAKSTYPKFSEVSGLGDAAFSNGFDLHILKGDDMYQIGVEGPFTDNVARAIMVAKEALAKV